MQTHGIEGHAAGGTHADPHPTPADLMREPCLCVGPLPELLLFLLFCRTASRIIQTYVNLPFPTHRVVLLHSHTNCIN